MFAGAPRALSATFDDAGFAFRLDEWRRLDGPDDRLPVDAIKSAMRNEGIYEWAAPAAPRATSARRCRVMVHASRQPFWAAAGSAE